MQSAECVMALVMLRWITWRMESVMVAQPVGKDSEEVHMPKLYTWKEAHS
jgi:hypothetical protein